MDKVPDKEYAENMCLSDHQTYHRNPQPSKFVPGLTYDNSYEVYHCPNCHQNSPGLEHGVTYYCDCGLIALSFGNSLWIWKEEGTELKKPTVINQMKAKCRN